MQLPNLDTIQGRAIIFGVRVVLEIVGGVVAMLRLLGWKPKDDAPELP